MWATYKKPHGTRSEVHLIGCVQLFGCTSTMVLGAFGDWCAGGGRKQLILMKNISSHFAVVIGFVCCL